MEAWKDIPDYEGLYQASNEGRIRTCEGKTTSNARYPVRRWKQRILKPKTENAKGYRKDLRVSLWKDGKPKDFLVARLVAMTWVDGADANMTVNHIDGDYTNNRIENLEWVTLGENIRHGFDTGLYSSCKRVVVKNIITGEKSIYRSMSQASVAMGMNTGYVSGKLKKGINESGIYRFALEGVDL